MIDNIIKYPDERLRSVSIAVKLPLNKDDKALLDEMFKYVKEHKDEAVGLSAVQVGVLKRMCSIRFTDVDKTHAYKLVNPKIIKRSTETVSSTEGCLSIDEKHDELIARARAITVIGFDAISGKNIVINAEGFLARVLQHEIDHMDGILYIDRIK